MRSKVGKLVGKTFEKALMTRVKGDWNKHSSYHIGEQIFYSEVSVNLFFFIYIQMAPSHDRFDIELAVSDSDSYPFDRPPLPPQYIRPFDLPFRFRVGTFFKKSAVVPGWWIWPNSTEENVHRRWTIDDKYEYDLNETLASVPFVVDNAIDKINMYGVPYLTSIAGQFGIEWPAELQHAANYIAQKAWEAGS